MVTPTIGAVVLVPFLFSDLSQAKDRPAVVIVEAGRIGSYVKLRASHTVMNTLSNSQMPTLCAVASNKLCPPRKIVYGE